MDGKVEEASKKTDEEAVKERWQRRAGPPPYYGEPTVLYYTDTDESGGKVEFEVTCDGKAMGEFLRKKFSGKRRVTVDDLNKGWEEGCEQMEVNLSRAGMDNLIEASLPGGSWVDGSNGTFYCRWYRGCREV